jgi:anti-anti-sigma factor
MTMVTKVDRIEGAVPVTVMSLDGELDASNYLRLVDDVRELYASGTRNLLLDLSDLSFMASSGLVALFSVVKVMNGEQPPDPEYGWGAFREVSRGLESGDVQTAVQEPQRSRERGRQLLSVGLRHGRRRPRNPRRRRPNPADPGAARGQCSRTDDHDRGRERHDRRGLG